MRFGHLKFGVAALALAVLLGACAFVEPPSDAEMAAVEAGQQTIVLVRVADEDELGEPYYPFGHNLYFENAGLALIGAGTDGEVAHEVSPLRFFSSETRDDGWTYLVLEPGDHMLAIQPTLYTDGLTYLRNYLTAPRWAIAVPDGVPMVYAGSLYLYGIGRETSLGGTALVGFDAERSTVSDETERARALATAHLPGLSPMETVLIEPAHP